MRPLGLRRRVTLAFGAGSLALSASLAVATYQLTESNVLEVRERSSIRSAYADAAVVRRSLALGDGDVVAVLRSLDTGRGRVPLLRRDGQWYARTADDGLTSAVPDGLLQMVEQGRPALQRVRVQGAPALLVGVPLEEPGSAYLEVDALVEIDRTLRGLATTLTVVAAATTFAGLALGSWAARRLLRPVQEMAAAAARVSAGDLATRLDPADDPDLAPLSTSFNHMVEELAARLERDRRFAADVSHELRSPLQTMSNATAVLHNRADGLDPRTRAAAQLVEGEVARFSALVQDLLELARDELPVALVETDVVALVREACVRRGVDPAVLDDGQAPDAWHLDARRFEGIVGNLLDNAERHGGGVVGVRLAATAEGLLLEVDDTGPGVPREERRLVFDRFGRGRAASSRRGTEGTGLGLALVAAHTAAHGGRVEIDDRPGGGARFRVVLPG